MIPKSLDGESTNGSHQSEEVVFGFGSEVHRRGCQAYTPLYCQKYLKNDITYKI